MASGKGPRGEVFMADATSPGFRGIIFGRGKTLWRGQVKSTRSAAFSDMEKANDDNEYKATLKPPRTDGSK